MIHHVSIYSPKIQLHPKVNGRSSLWCDLFWSKIVFEGKDQLYQYKIFPPCIQHVKHSHVDEFFTVKIINSCKRHSSSFFSVLLVFIVSAVSLQITADHSRKQQENKRFPVGVCAPHSLNRGLELNLCVAQCIELFQSFTSSTPALK